MAARLADLCAVAYRLMLICSLWHSPTMVSDRPAASVKVSAYFQGTVILHRKDFDQDQTILLIPAMANEQDDRGALC